MGSTLGATRFEKNTYLAIQATSFLSNVSDFPSSRTPEAPWKRVFPSLSAAYRMAPGLGHQKSELEKFSRWLADLRELIGAAKVVVGGLSMFCGI